MQKSSKSNPIFKTSGHRFTTGIVLAVLSLALNLLFIHQPVVAICTALLFVLVGAVKPDDDLLNSRAVCLLWALIFPLMAYAVCMLSQYELDAPFFTLGFLPTLLGMILHTLPALVLLAFTLRPAWALTIPAIVLMLFTTVEHYVYSFRGAELSLLDILAVRTALNVVGGYQLVLTKRVFYGLAFTVLICFLVFGLPEPRFSGKRAAARSRGITALGAAALAVTFAVFNPQLPVHTFSHDGAYLNGYLLNFTLQTLRTKDVTAPEGYSAEAVDALAEEYATGGAITDAAQDKPDIIVIMDESFADLSVLGSELHTNQPVTPFIDSLTENTIRGYALASVFGGGTPNSEYEFFTGNSLALAPGSIIYQQYLRSPAYSMVEELKENDYKAIAMHPFNASGWRRPYAYSCLGFDETYFLDDFPQQNLVRSFVSDQEMFEKLTSLYEENKASGENVFLFGVTMQNHGGYTYEGDNYTKTISLNGYSQAYPLAEQYLSLIHETDSAVEYLVNYFRNADHKVILVFYGDHLPNLDTGFLEELHGGSLDTLDEQEEKYSVPFFVWANYDIPEENVGLTSLNYLSNYVYQAAGFALPEYNQYLTQLQEAVPAMNSIGYYSKTAGAFLPYSEAKGEEKHILNQYLQLEYNALVDTRHRNSRFFPTPAD